MGERASDGTALSEVAEDVEPGDDLWPASPLTIVVVGSGTDAERLLGVVGGELPRADVRLTSSTSIETIRAASASAHLVVAAGPDRELDGLHSLFDAVVTTEREVAQLVSRAQAFDRRRTAHELPPDIAPRLVPWAPCWGGHATRLGARVERVFASTGVASRVDHIGSTSVPGLQAKDIVDLQVTVERLESVDLCDLALRDAGFVDVQLIAPDAPGVSSDSPHCLSGLHGDVAAGDKRLYASVDDVRRAIVHVRRDNSANWRYALLFRDWLRANGRWRDDYARHKALLAKAHSRDASFDGYARSKEAWFDKAYRLSEEWAARTGWEPPVLKKTPG